MNDLTQVSQGANDIRFIAARFRGFLAAAEALDKLGSLEGAINESTNRLGALRQQEEDAKETAAAIIAEAESSAKAIGEEAARAATSKAFEADAYHAQQKQLAQSKIEEATHEAHDIIASAENEVKTHRDAIEKHRATLASLQQSIAARTADHELILAQIDDANDTHERVTKLIADLKSKF
jgi:chromosome segregation ATPase